ncbi:MULTISPECIES: type II CRISPR RNA-guided endonuclease Cas9 [unclassified Carboxylicivirga]|uniref:type II CRISPR RNA-guided endonuclease Cas9 n=1 Tax=Carboxylicivirga TaxID=1628153 RepID=UPI003D33F2CD
MKKILGLDLGTTSIGWAFVHEAEKESEHSVIIDLGVRVNPLSTDEQTDFEKGRTLSVNADRTLKRSMRRNLQRFKQRRENLIQLLKKHKLITNEVVLTENGNATTFETLKLRAIGAQHRIELDEFARVLLALNKKRGYKSSRKTKSDEESGQLIDGMDVAKYLYENQLTPGQYCFQQLEQDKANLPDFYRSDLQNELDKVWQCQQQYYPEILDVELYKAIEGQGQQNTRKRFLAIKGIYTAENKGKRNEIKLQAYQWRSNAINQQLSIEQVAYVITEINNNLNNSSGYLGAISDRSKELYFNKETVGEYLYRQLQANPHTSLKNQVFYRQDYLDEFEQIWETQKKYHAELSDELKEEVRDVVIFYQRRLKSQKGLISFCEFESKQKEVAVDGKRKLKTIGSRVCPKSSPLFQEYRIWHDLSHVLLKAKDAKEGVELSLEDKQVLFEELNIKEKLSKKEILKLLGYTVNDYDLNYTELKGNTTNNALYAAFAKIIEHEGYELNLKSDDAKTVYDKVKELFKHLNINSSILKFDALLDKKALEKQEYYQLWHLLYSYEGDKSKTGMDALYQKLNDKYGFKKEWTQYLANVQFQDDYASLSTKAISKIFPYIKESSYCKACELAGYNHSASLTKEENAKRILKDKLELLPKNSLRNPVVEKILNQLVNVVNSIIESPNMGKPDEIRIELSRELKKNAKERAELTSAINKAHSEHEKYRKELQKSFGIKNPSRNDIIRYRLYKELEMNGYKTLYTNTYISPSQLFSKEVDIEHIIPKARLFDDSFSNKTLEFKKLNIDKGEETAYDYIKNKFGANVADAYVARVEDYYNNGHISKAKYLKLCKKAEDIGEGFIERDLRESQYIAKKAKEMLFELCETVVSTTGSITARLREDWGLINVMKELNMEKYRALGMTHVEERKDGQKIEQITDWTKRNDHRHHAMDALTVAFTKHNHIQYLNNLNARKNEKDKKRSNIIAIENKETTKNTDGKRVFKEPIPFFRTVVKQHLESILISHKAKNKVVTRNRNKVKGSDVIQTALTPRGQLHKETVYGKMQQYATKLVKVGASFDAAMAKKISKKAYKDAVLARLNEFDNNPKKAFGGKNSPAKNPVVTKAGEVVPEKVKVVWLEDNYTIRKEIVGSNPNSKQFVPDFKSMEKVIDRAVRGILERRLQQFGNDTKEAFSNLDQNPIWLNKEKGIAIKRVTISGINNAEALHCKKNHLGEVMMDEQGREIAVDFVSTGNNHHVAIYRDENGKLQEEVVSFYEAVGRVNADSPIINKEHPIGWEFLFSMKQNEMFVFPSDDFDPLEIDLLNPDNRSVISKYLFRVQKIGSKDYWFRHHLETTVEVKKALVDTAYKRIQNTQGLKNLIKVRTNHLGHIVKVGE